MESENLQVESQGNIPPFRPTPDQMAQRGSIKKMCPTPLAIVEKVAEAVESGSYFIAISYKDKRGNLQHWYKRVEYSNEDVIPSLKCIAETFAQEIRDKFKWA